MDAETRARLNALNRTFYAITADEFHETRAQAWPGWQQLLGFLPAGGLRLLDVGCGNGRLGVFLGAQRGWPLVYHGMDNSGALLERARAGLSAYPHVSVQLELRDIVENPPDAGVYDVVALFGVLHHVPGAAQRAGLLRALARRVAAGGLFVFACWRFYEYERFRARIVAWPAEYRVEKHDYLLDWRRGERALRYCHYVDDEEHAALVAASGLREIAHYRADGEGGQANLYSVLRG